MKLTIVKIPKFITRLFPNYVWDFSFKEKTVYLTFDDGPTPEVTTWTLNILKQYNAKATFFCIGQNVENHPEIYQNILSDGHCVGNHTQNHLKGWRTSTNAYIKNTKQASKHIESMLFRPPYGQIKPKQGKALISLGYTIIMWTVIAFDWDANVSKEQCLKNVISNTKDGSIVVFHDSIKASKNMMYTLPKVLAYFDSKGYTFKAIKA